MTVKVTPASQAPQPGSGWTHSHSAANKSVAAAQKARPARRLPVTTHQPVSRHTANQPLLLDLPSPSTAIPAVATAAYSSAGRQPSTSGTAAATATSAPATASGALGL